jgi:nucleoside 2-deoxyribosyltransferase
MKIFLSYRFTGEKIEELKEVIGKICSGIGQSGHNHYCSFNSEDFYKSNKFTNKQILEHALNELEVSDCILAFVKSEEKAEGMLLEIGYAKAKNKKFILAIKKGIKTTFLREIAEKIIEFKDIDDLTKQLEKLKV